MLLFTVLVRALFVLQFAAPATPPPSTEPVAIATTTVAIPTTQASPTSQPSVQITLQAPAAPSPSLIDAFSTHGFGRYMTGKETLTVKDVLNPSFWTDTLKDLLQP